MIIIKFNNQLIQIIKNKGNKMQWKNSFHNYLNIVLIMTFLVSIFRKKKLIIITLHKDCQDIWIKIVKL